MLTRWLESKGLAVPDLRLFSDVGFVANGIALGFLFTTNSGQAYIDHVAADPDRHPGDRGDALDLLFSTLEAEAKDRGCVMVTALATLPAMRRRFEDRRYSHHAEFGLYYKVLGDK